jgi:hypothetical protein
MTPMKLRWLMTQVFAVTRRANWAVICLAFALPIFPACIKREREVALPTVPPPPPPLPESQTMVPPRQSAPVMAWGGMTVLGYMRVELWAGQSPAHPSIQDLVINRADGVVHRHRGHMIRLPADLLAVRGRWNVFVLTPEEIERNHGIYPEILATVSPEGVLRLYEFSAGDGTGACDLQPIH